MANALEKNLKKVYYIYPLVNRFGVKFYFQRRKYEIRLSI